MAEPAGCRTVKVADCGSLCVLRVPPRVGVGVFDFDFVFSFGAPHTVVACGYFEIEQATRAPQLRLQDYRA